MLLSPIRSPLQPATRSPFDPRLGGGPSSSVLNFATLTPAQLQSRFGWTRSGAGTMENSGGDVVYGAHNLLLNSETFVGGWSLYSATRTSGVADPIGGNSAVTLTATASNGGLDSIASVSSGLAVSTAVWVRRRTGVGTVQLITIAGGASTIAVTGAWTRFQLTGVSGGTAYMGVAVLTSGDAVDIWHPQLNIGTLQPYVPTTTSPVYLMRNPDYTHGVPGLLLEGARTQLLESGAIGAQLVTQTKTVTAVAHTLSFFGTGTVTLTGAHSATVVGTGATVLREFTFTPSAGSLTLTVTGTVTDGQLEAGSYATSRTPNPTSGTVTRVADVAEIGPGPEFDALFPSAQGTIVVEWVDIGSTDGDILAIHSGGTTNELISFYYSGTSILTLCRAGSANQLAATVGTRIPNALNKAAISWGAGGLSAVLNGGTVQSNGSATIPAPTSARFAGTALASSAQGATKPTKITTRPTQLTGAALQALTA